jgi:outer membrane receptor protein involved in Fe transport
MAAQNVREAQGTVVQWALSPQPLGDALNQVAQAAGLQIVFYTAAAGDLNAPAVVGSFDVATALDKLLAQTPLEYEFLKADTIVIRLRKELPSTRAAHSESGGSSAESASSRGARQHSLVDPRPLELDEVRVTARRRSEDLQDTPVAVTALGSEALEVRAVRSLDALAQFVPNVQFDGAAPLSGAAYNATLFIRGVGQNDFAIFQIPASRFIRTASISAARSVAS